MLIHYLAEFLVKVGRVSERLIGGFNADRLCHFQNHKI